MTDRISASTPLTQIVTYGSLFSGIGGFDLGFDRAGMQCRWQVEIDPYCQKVLTKHWPEVPKFGDIRECGANNLERVDVICGGFPCQDISYAGKGAGIDGERSGLWYEYARIIREMGPRCVAVENVAALLTRGLDQVLGTLDSLGYDAEWECLPAAAFGAPHIRDRLFIIAYANSTLQSGADSNTETHELGRMGEVMANSKSERCGETGQYRKRPAQRTAGRREVSAIPGPDRFDRYGEISSVSDAHSIRRHEMEQQNSGRTARERAFGEAVQRSRSWWATEPAVGRVANGISRRVDRLRGLGNAIVPQVAEYIGRRIVESMRIEVAA